MMKKCGCGCSKVGWWLVVIGGLNWGLVGIGVLFGLGNLNVVNLILGSLSWLEAIVYILVGLSTVMMLVGCKCKKCKSCRHGKCDNMGGEREMDHPHEKHHGGGGSDAAQQGM